MRLAEARGAKVEASTIRLYAGELTIFPDEVIAQACDEFEQETIGQYTVRWPDLEALKSACRRIQAPLKVKKKFFCGDCQSECGMLYFDKPRHGRRLRGVEVVITHPKYAEPCPCGGTDYDWEAMYLDRRQHPEKYSTLGDVMRELMVGKAMK